MALNTKQVLNAEIRMLELNAKKSLAGSQRRRKAVAECMADNTAMVAESGAYMKNYISGIKSMACHTERERAGC